MVTSFCERIIIEEAKKKSPSLASVSSAGGASSSGGAGGAGDAGECDDEAESGASRRKKVGCSPRNE